LVELCFSLGWEGYRILAAGASCDKMDLCQRLQTASTTGTGKLREIRNSWDAHNNRACRGERDKALALYESLSEEEREKVPQVLRVWLRYRSEKYFGEGRTPPGGDRK
jgi:hypothetical protein